MKRLPLVTLLAFLPGAPAFAHEGHHAHAERAIDLTLLGFSGLKEMFNVHPAFVHFPIALVPSALLLYFLGTVLRNRSLNVASRVCLSLALVSGVIAVATGLTAQESFPHNDVIHHMMRTHKVIGLALAGLLTALTAWSFLHADQRPKGVWGFLTVLAIASYLALQNGDLGSRMVYVQGAAVKPAVAAITTDEEGPDHGPMHHHDHDE